MLAWLLGFAALAAAVHESSDPQTWSLQGCKIKISANMCMASCRTSARKSISAATKAHLP